MQKCNAVLLWRGELRCEGSVRVSVAGRYVQLVGLAIERAWTRDLGRNIGAQNGCFWW